VKLHKTAVRKCQTCVHFVNRLGNIAGKSRKKPLCSSIASRRNRIHQGFITRKDTSNSQITSRPP